VSGVIWPLILGALSAFLLYVAWLNASPRLSSRVPSFALEILKRWKLFAVYIVATMPPDIKFELQH
ncbi:MAG: hypothetical protein LC672_05265, partial [Acidobacteria bacterium]|nr:hypothetical protein [Acidobacteriota bacterium]